METIVIGGGPAGCAAAYTLDKQGHRVHLFEAAESLGGRTRQLHRDGYNLATGALFLMGGIYPRTMALLEEMGHRRDLVPWRGLAELADHDDRRYPVRFDSIASFFKVPTLTLGDRLKLLRTAVGLLLSRGARNPFNGTELAAFDHGENLEDWSRAHVGDQAFEYVMRPIMDFLYAVPLRELSTPFPQAVIRQAHKLALSVPPQGIGQISDWLAAKLPAERVHLSCPVDAVAREAQGYRVVAGGQEYRADGLVVATEAFVAARLLGDLLPAPTQDALMSTPYTEYAHVAIAYERNPWPDAPVDLVLPVGVGGVRDVGAIVLHGRRSPGSVPPGAELVGVYFNTPPLARMSDDDIREAAIGAVHDAFGEAPRPQFVHLFRYDKGLTIARPGHYARLDAVHGALPPGIRLAGDYFSQAGVEAAVYSGERAALELTGRPVPR